MSGETWHQVALTADSPISFDHFGISVSISGNFAIVGAPTFGDGPGGSGRAFVLDLSVIGTDCAGDGRLDECDLDCNANGIADRCELLTQTSIDCNRNSILDECEITMDPDTDCNTNLVPDECELITGEPHLVNRIIATGLTSQDRFGGSFAISGDTMIVGADGDAIGSGNFYNGSAYIFERQNGNWIQRMRISASDTQSGDAFGISVAIDGDFAVVGAELEDQGGLNAGAAYIFKRMGTTWQQTQKLIAPDASSSDRFGSNVAIQGDTVFIGAPIASDSLGSEGAVYHFRRVGTDWLFDSKITASDINSCRFFGTSMSISGDSIAIGAPFSDAAVPLSGAVYIFTRISDVWLQTAKLESAEAAAIDYFGQSVALHGNLVVAGTPNKDDRGADSGAAIIFEEVNGTWTQIATLYANDEAPFDNFGRSIDILGNIVVVGSHYHDDVAYDSGAAYVFHRVGASWIQVAKLAAQNGAAGDNLGQSVRIDPYDMRILVGAWHDDGASFDSGSVCYFELDLANNDCNSDLLLDECEAISSTVPRFVAAILSESLSASDLCAFDSDHNGVLDGIDVAGLVNEMLN
ncbi:MAG: FG-GAP repeat protein [Planctomycetes bacterium]|nr:FG-GAP repeat protein [Planctomycetota bacterium]